MDGITFSIELFAQAVGFVALAFAVSVFQATKGSSMNKLQTIAASLYALHFFMLGAYTGSAMNVLGGVRNITFLEQKLDHG